LSQKKRVRCDCSREQAARLIDSSWLGVFSRGEGSEPSSLGQKSHNPNHLLFHHIHLSRSNHLLPRVCSLSTGTASDSSSCASPAEDVDSTKHRHCHGNVTTSVTSSSAALFSHSLRLVCDRSPLHRSSTTNNTAGVQIRHLSSPSCHTTAHTKNSSPTRKSALPLPPPPLMTSAISHNAPNPLNATSASNANAASSTTSPLSGAVPAQLPVRSYANATKTASPAPSAQAGASAQNAKSADTPVNGANTMAHGGSQPNGTPAHMDHGRKPSVVISASGASGQIPNGGPVGQSARPPINFGSMGASGSPLPQQSTPYGSQGSSLPAPNANPRVISPAHSPSPIPQPPASGGRPPSGLQGQSNGMTFGSMGESDPVSE